jgi:hypothetical protein
MIVDVLVAAFKLVAWSAAGGLALYALVVWGMMGFPFRV